MANTNQIKQSDILNAVQKVKNYHYKMYQVRTEPEKVCLWCKEKIKKMKSFCSKECELNHKKAIEKFEFEREEKERIARAK